VAKLLQVTPSAEFDLTGRVNIEMVNAKVRRMKVPTVQKFLGRKESRPFRQAVLRFLNQNDGVRAYLVYEVYRTNKLKIVTEEGKEISPSLKIGVVHPLVSDHEVSFSFKRTALSEVEISGDGYYAFAVRTAKLISEPGKGILKIEPTGFLKPKEWGIKSAGTDDAYSAPLAEHFSPIMLKSPRMVGEMR